MSTRSVQVGLGSTIVYVSGRVNGVDTTFTLSDTTDTETIWTADVARNELDVYVCQITAINSLGVSSTIETTLYYGLIDLITDRTLEDVRLVSQLNQLNLSGMSEEQLTEYLSGLKGAYNATDLNRVESAVAYLVERLKIIGYYLNLDTKTLWSVSEWLTTKDSIRYLGNVQAIKDCVAATEDMPEVPESLDQLDYNKANDIEKILMLVNDIITNVTKAWFYSNDLYSGEV